MFSNQQLPREIIKWLDSLDLAYAVRNVRRDLQNGFIVAEILSRYYPKDVSIYSYDNGLNLLRKKDNWEQIAKVLAKKDFIIGEETYEPIYNLADGAALEFLEGLYEFLTRRKLQKEQRKKIKREDDVPSYAKSTAAQLAKTRELTRIVDDDEKRRQTAMTIAIHNEKVREDKQDSNIIEYLVLKRRAQLEEQLRKEEEEMLERKRKYNLDQTQQPEVKEIKIKSYKSSTSKKTKEQQGQYSESKGILETLQETAAGLLKKDFVEDLLRKLKIDKKQSTLTQIFGRCDEFKQPDNSFDGKVLEAFLTHFQQETSLDSIVEQIDNNLVYFKQFFFLFLKPLEVAPVNSNTFSLIISLFQNVAQPLCDIDQQTLQLMFESILMKPLLQIVIKHPTKREQLIETFYSFCAPDSLSRLHMIKKIKEHLATDITNFISIAAYLVQQNYGKDFDQDLYLLLLHYSFQALSSPSAFTRTNGLKIINEIVHYNYLPVLSKVYRLQKLVNDSWWEVNAQILIICAKLLLYIASEKEGQNKDAEKSHESNLESAKSGNSEEEKVKSQQEFLMNIIFQLFRSRVSQNILRIGLIYLAPIIRIYPNLCDRYLDILLELYDKSRETVLMTETPAGMEEGQVVSGYASFKYKLTSAPEIWNSVGIAESLDKFTQNADLQEYQKVHLEILIGCLYQELQPVHAENWIKIYQNINTLIFTALLDTSLCILASDILKKLFLFQSIQQTVLEVSFTLFSKTLEGMYHPDIEDNCKQNLLAFFEFLIEEQPEVFHEYIFDIIKNFSEDHKSLFLQSNLIEFMNTLAKNRRNRMFKIEYLPQ